MPGEGQFVNPVQVEVTSDIGADVTPDGTAPPGTDLRGMAVMYYDQTNNLLYVPRTNAAGQTEVEVVAMPPVVIAKGTVIQSLSVPVGVGATVPVVVPANTLAINCQNVTGVASLFAVREVGGAPGTGMVLPNYGIFAFNEAVAQIEIEDIGGVAGTVNVTFEIT